ncbi:MAG: glucan biosynthesis protein [Candidatus Omnitrophica bacterium]|nr:glucan biosynthesis protein [Candidatus Omnitrophota bacterium]
MHFVFWGRIVLGLWMMWPGNLYAAQETFGFQSVTDKAKELAGRPFQEVPDNKVPEFLKKIGYDQWRDIRFQPQKALWYYMSIPFKIQFFHPGFLYNRPVIIHYIDQAGIHQFPFSPELFGYGKNNFREKVPSDLDFTGFRVHYPINRVDYYDEMAVFLGASYFRAVGKQQTYGISARGLAVNMAEESGEEFPFFKEFWIVRPQNQAKEITVYALLDSPSVSGAYEYIIKPAEETLMRVNSALFIRRKIKKLGIAPMTTMFLYGENSGLRDRNDFRPEVHDSDGLLIFSRSGERIWRPLINPQRILINVFEVGTPQGFGLAQRDRNFDHYQDLEARYDLRPGLWIVPQGDWGKGHVELVQIPANNEYNENVNAFWVPEQSPEPGETLNFSYTMKWYPARREHFSLGHVTDTRIVRASEKGEAKFIIDFQGEELNAMPSNKNLTADISVTKGHKITGQQVFKNPATEGWRLVFQIGPDKKTSADTADLRVFLKDGPGALTETWTYTFLP